MTDNSLKSYPFHSYPFQNILLYFQDQNKNESDTSGVKEKGTINYVLGNLYLMQSS